MGKAVEAAKKWKRKVERVSEEKSEEQRERQGHCGVRRSVGRRRGEYQQDNVP